MKKVLIVLMALLMVFSLAANGKSDSDSSAKGEFTEFIVNNLAEPESLDPHKITGVPEHNLYQALFEGLISFDPKTGRGIPGIAESWDITNGGKTYTFHLRDAVWSDGVAITAQTVYDSWIRGLDPETANPYAWFPNMFIAGAAEFNGGEAGPDAVQIKVIDDKTFEMDLVGPLPYVIDALAHYAFAIVPMHVINEFGSDWIKPENFVSDGPFVLDTWVPQQELTVVPNDKYWDKDAVQLDKITYLPIVDDNTGFNMYMNGELDWSEEVPLDQMDAVSSEPFYKNAPYLGTYYYLLETQTAPFDNVKVRQALSLAFDRETIVKKITKGGQIPAYSMVPPMDGYPSLIDPETQDLAANIAKAKELLAEAGYPNGEGWPEGIEILYNTSEAHKKIAEYIQEQWKVNLGIDVTLINMEWKTYLQQRREHNFQISRSGWIGDYPDPNTFLDMFLAPETMDGEWGGNYGRYKNENFDSLIEKAATMDAGAARFSTLKQAEEIFISKDQALIPIYFYTTNQLIDTDVWGGWYPNIMDYHPPKYIYKK